MAAMTGDDLLARTAANRLRIAGLYAQAPASLLDGDSLCTGWSLRTLLGHVVMPLVTSPMTLALAALRHRSVHAASGRLAEELGRRPVGELVTVLRERADKRVAAPGVGPMGQFADCCIHLRDAARPLGADVDVPLDDWTTVLAWLASRAASLGHVPRGLLADLSWRATDVNWSTGDGPEVRGPAEALALAMTGRPVVLPELDGDGVTTLRGRLIPPAAGGRSAG